MGGVTTMDEFVELIARAMCVGVGCDPLGNDPDYRFDNESADGWLNWFFFKPEAYAVVKAILYAELAVVPKEATEKMWNAFGQASIDGVMGTELLDAAITAGNLLKGGQYG